LLLTELQGIQPLTLPCSALLLTELQGIQPLTLPCSALLLTEGSYVSCRPSSTSPGSSQPTRRPTAWWSDEASLLFSRTFCSFLGSMPTPSPAEPISRNTDLSGLFCSSLDVLGRYSELWYNILWSILCLLNGLWIIRFTLKISRIKAAR
jgi:hypothetical protein